MRTPDHPRPALTPPRDLVPVRLASPAMMPARIERPAVRTLATNAMVCGVSELRV